jgi:RimJ/RimL family protein N-acetyltransferase
MDDEFRRANGWTDIGVRTIVAAIRSPTSVRAQAWAVICDRRTGELIGSISATSVDRTAATCDLGWWLGPRWRGLGYGTEAVYLAITALHTAGIRRVVIGTAVDNLAVLRVAAKVGAIELRRGGHTLPDGTVVDGVWLAHDHP